MVEKSAGEDKNIEPVSIEKNTKKKDENPKSRRYKHPMPGVLRVLSSGMFLLVVSILITWYVLWRGFNCDNEALGAFIRDKTGLFSYSCLIIFLLTTTLAAFLWRPFLAAGIVFSIASALTYAHIQKLEVRATPLLPEDLLMADQMGELESFIDVGDIVRLVAGICFVLLGCGLLEHFLRRVIGRDRKALPFWDRIALIPRLAVGFTSLAILVMLAAPVMQQDASKIDPEWLDTNLDFVAWRQWENYGKNGFVIGFLYNLSSLRLKEPEGYSRERVAEIYEEYEADKEKDADRKPLSELVDNLIVVLSESSYDPAVLGERYANSGGDVTPNLHKLFKEYPSGYMYSPEYGGGTANVEFAVLTGLSNAWLNTTPYVSSLAKAKTVEGIASLAKANGFENTAIHSYYGTMYKRDFVYNNMLFDDFIDVEGMQHREHEYLSEYINDRSVYQEALDVLRNGDGKKMLNLVTMQNHAPYNFAKYPETNFPIKNPGGVINVSYTEASYESLYHADEYLGEFIEGLDKLEGKTVMLWYGDHAAGVLRDYAESGDPELVNLTHLTPYFVYANFGLNDLYTEEEIAEWNKELGFDFPTKGVDLPTVTPNCLSNIMYNLLGAEKPVLGYVLDEVCSNIDTAILAPSYHQESGLPENKLAEDYELLSYDLLGGKYYWRDLEKK